MTDPDRAAVIADVCGLLAAGSPDAARDALAARYPFVAREPEVRRTTPLASMRVFLRDGFVDRYSGSRLVNPAVLRLLAWALPDVFPWHQNWRMSHTHPAWWDLAPTLDHVVPVARGGLDMPENLVTCSQVRNAVKAGWLLEELGWTLVPPGDPSVWDGLSAWVVRVWSGDGGLSRTALPEGGRALHEAYVRRWCAASAKALAQGTRTNDRAW